MWRAFWTSNKTTNHTYKQHISIFNWTHCNDCIFPTKRSPFHLSAFHAAGSFSECGNGTLGWLLTLNTSYHGICSCQCYCLPVLCRIIKQWWGKMCHLPSLVFSRARFLLKKRIRLSTHHVRVSLSVHSQISQLRIPKLVFNIIPISPPHLRSFAFFKLKPFFVFYISQSET